MRKGIEAEVDAAFAGYSDPPRSPRAEHITRRRTRADRAVDRRWVGTLTIMREVGCAKATVWRWQERFAAEGVDGLLGTRAGRQARRSQG